MTSEIVNSLFVCFYKHEHELSIRYLEAKRLPFIQAEQEM